QQTDQGEHHHQHHLIGAGIGDQDIGHQMGNIGGRIEHTQPEMGAFPTPPTGLAYPWGTGGPADQPVGRQGDQKVDEHAPIEGRQPLRRHLALNGW
ncbi:MAG: hypothetical protein ACK56I_09185, partial [bacterium]